MARKIVLADTSVSIEYFRKTDKSKSKLFKLLDDDYQFCICAITQYEIYSGTTPEQTNYWNAFLQKIVVLPFDQLAVNVAVDVNNKLKTDRKQVEMADLFIAAIALLHEMPLLTLNIKHFERVAGLKLIG